MQTFIIHFSVERNITMPLNGNLIPYHTFFVNQSKKLPNKFFETLTSDARAHSTQYSHRGMDGSVLSRVSHLKQFLPFAFPPFLGRGNRFPSRTKRTSL